MSSEIKDVERVLPHYNEPIRQATTGLSVQRTLGRTVYGPEVIDSIDRVIVWSSEVLDALLIRKYQGEDRDLCDRLLTEMHGLRVEVEARTAPYLHRERLWGLSWVDAAPRWWRVSDELHRAREKAPDYTPGSALRRGGRSE